MALSITSNFTTIYLYYTHSYAKVEKIPGGAIEESCVLKGVMINKDVTHAKMRRYIENPRIVLLDCSLEYKKGESQTNVEIIGEQDFTRMLQIEEEYVQRICADIIAVKPDLVFTEKGVLRSLRNNNHLTYATEIISFPSKHFISSTLLSSFGCLLGRMFGFLANLLKPKDIFLASMALSFF